MLNRAAGLAPGQPLADAAVTDAEKRNSQSEEASVRTRWEAVTGHTPSEGEVLSVLSLLSVEVLDVEPGGLGEREAIRTLSTVVIEDPSLEGAAWSSVLKACEKDGDRALRAGSDRLAPATARRWYRAEGRRFLPGGH